MGLNACRVRLKSLLLKHLLDLLGVVDIGLNLHLHLLRDYVVRVHVPQALVLHDVLLVRAHILYQLFKSVK